MAPNRPTTKTRLSGCAKAKQAHDALGQKAEWRAYLGTLREKHQRKYKLMPLLGML